MKLETTCIQAGYRPKSGEPRVLPIAQSTTYKYSDAQTMSDLFTFDAAGHFYTRLSNPTLEAVELKITALEGGVGAMLTASGQAASAAAILTLCGAGDHVVASAAIYGGTYNLFHVTLRRLGLDFTFVPPDASDDAIAAAIQPNTRLIFGETLSNPSLSVLDIARFADVAHRHHLPLFVDNTFATPALCRPFEHGADIITHSTSKYMDGHAVALGGAVVDSGRFDWAASGRHPCMTDPDDSYHGLIYTEKFGTAAFINKARAQGMRDIGYQQSPQNAFLLNLGLETLPLRMERHCQNALAIAQFLKTHPQVSWVNYSGLPDSPWYTLAQRYLPAGQSGVVCFGVKGGYETAAALMERVQIIAPVVHVCDLHSGIVHPASTTHGQLNEQQLAECGVMPDGLRFSVGLEHIDDLMADLNQALEGKRGKS